MTISSKNSMQRLSQKSSASFLVIIVPQKVTRNSMLPRRGHFAILPGPRRSSARPTRLSRVRRLSATLPRDLPVSR